MQEKIGPEGRPRKAPADGLAPLRDALRHLAADDLEFRVPVDTGSPFASLCDDLNRTAESLQRRREEVVRAVELYCLRRFGTVLVHDLKNLAARLALAHANLCDGVDDGEVIEACASTVKDTAERIQSLVRRFQDQREAMVLRIRGSVNHAVQAAVEHSGVGKTAGIRVAVECGEIPDTLIDHSYLQEAFVNLLRNAAEAMPGGGSLRVRTGRVEHDGRPEAEIVISDDGPGMTEEFVRQDLFAPFRSTKKDGLGLGMFSCRETVELHGGRILVDSEPGRGTTFRIYLPIVAQAEERD